MVLSVASGVGGLVFRHGHRHGGILCTTRSVYILSLTLELLFSRLVSFKVIALFRDHRAYVVSSIHIVSLLHHYPKNLPFHISSNHPHRRRRHACYYSFSYSHSCPGSRQQWHRPHETHRPEMLTRKILTRPRAVTPLVRRQTLNGSRSPYPPVVVHEGTSGLTILLK